MRKAISSVMIVAICLVFGSSMAFAGPNCASTGGAKSADKAACSATGTTAKLTGADKTCGVTGQAINASAAVNCTPEECADWAKFCESYDGGKCEVRMMSVKGMTCTGCENGLKASLTKVPGVLKVAKVCHKSGVAVVAINPDEVKDDVLTKTVANKGYEAAIIPAVATTTAGASVKNVSDKPAGCPPDCASTCCPKGKGEKKSGSSPS